MSEKKQIQEYIQRAEKIRSTNRTSCVELQNYLFYQHLKVTNESSTSFMCGTCGISKTAVKKTFKRAFKTLSKLQKAKFYFQNVEFVERAIKEINSKQEEEKCKYKNNYSLLKASIFIKDEGQFKKWSTTEIEVVEEQKILRILRNKEEIDLHTYIIRKSMNKDKQALVLQSTQHEDERKTIRMSCYSMNQQQFYQIMEQYIKEAQYENIKEYLLKQNKFPKMKKNKKSKPKQQFEVEMDPITVILSRKSKEEKSELSSIRQSIKQAQKLLSIPQQKYEKIQKNLVSNQLIQSLLSFKNFKEVQKGIFYEREGNKVRKVFQFPKSKVKQQQVLQFLDDFGKFKERKQTIQSIKLINSFPAEKTKVYQEFDHYGEEDAQYIFFRHYFMKGNTHYFIDKTVEAEEITKPIIETILRGNIEYCIWRIRQIGKYIQLLVEANINFSKKPDNKKELISEFIGDFQVLRRNNELQSLKNSYDESDLFEEGFADNLSIESEEFENQSLQQITHTHQREFYTMNGSFDTYLNQNRNESWNKLQNAQDLFENFKGETVSRSVTQSGSTSFNHRYLQKPRKKQQSVYQKGKDNMHWLWSDVWKRTQNGDMINIDYEKIKIQSSVLGLVIKKIGKNIITGKSVMNMSLPIQIFGTDSNIQRLAGGFTFGPTQLQLAAKCKSPVERLARVFCFGWGFTFTYMKMQKPFNPILGETYQGQIDGCPIYAEQISHHPPISSLFMKGRGYTLYGSFEAKVQLGINTASGINDGFLYISFHQSDYKKNRVKFNTPPGQMAGIIYGQRKMSLTKQSYYVDEENRLLCVIVWGKNKGADNQYGKYNDYFEGQIVKVKENVSLQNPKDIKLKNSNIEEKYGKIYGRSLQKIVFYDQIIFDIDKERPHKIVDYQPCLPSDSRLRKDLILRKQNNLEAAQEAKQQLQSMQRKDRNLRSKFIK